MIKEKILWAVAAVAVSAPVAWAVPTTPTTTGSTTSTVMGTGYNLQASGSLYEASPQEVSAESKTMVVVPNSSPHVDSSDPAAYDGGATIRVDSQEAGPAITTTTTTTTHQE